MFHESRQGDWRVINSSPYEYSVPQPSFFDLDKLFKSPASPPSPYLAQLLLKNTVAPTSVIEIPPLQLNVKAHPFLIFGCRRRYFWRVYIRTILAQIPHDRIIPTSCVTRTTYTLLGVNWRSFWGSPDGGGCGKYKYLAWLVVKCYKEDPQGKELWLQFQKVASLRIKVKEVVFINLEFHEAGEGEGARTQK